MTARAAALRAMAERVEAAEGPETGLFMDAARLAWGVEADERKRTWTLCCVGAFTDAALAFVPEGRAIAVISLTISGGATVHLAKVSDEPSITVRAKTLALAILASALRALAEETEDE